MVKLNSIRVKLVAPLVLFMLVIATFNTVYFPAQQEEAINEGFRIRLTKTLETLILGTSIAMDSGNLEGVYATVDHSAAGPVIVTGTAFGGLSAAPGRVFPHPPLANEHGRVVLKRVLGYDDERVNKLQAEGVFSSE